MKNLTQHEVVFFDNENREISSIMPSGEIARVEQSEEFIDVVEVENGWNIDIVRFKPVGITGLEQGERSGQMFIVSDRVAQVAKQMGRLTSDLYVPAGLVRDDKGRIIGCTMLATP